MRKAILAIGVLALMATRVLAEMPDISSLREGDMRRLVVHEEPLDAPTASFDLEDYLGSATLADWEGKYVLVNIWASWCAPCRREMPMLSVLQAEMGGEDFEVLTIASGYHDQSKIDQFFYEIGVGNLPRHQDGSRDLTRDLQIFGLPTTLIVDPDGKEIARLRGDADWSSDSAKKILTALLQGRGEGAGASR